MASLVQGNDGVSFYGTTSQGGTAFSGTIFKLVLNLTAGTPTAALASLYSFCLTAGCPDGSAPAAALIQASDGNFYGTAPHGGTSGFGTAFKITSTGVLTTLHTFTGMAPEGGTPIAGLVQGTDGNFYGANQQGGAAANNGTIFRMDSSGNLFSSDLPVANGSHPTAALVAGAPLSFYGVAPLGGSAGDGTVFIYSGGSTISGVVSLAGGTLTGITITISMDAAGTTLTGDNGYSFTEPNGGNYLITPTAAGYSFNPEWRLV